MRLSHRTVILLRRAGDYKIEKRLGGGRYGVCYLSRDLSGKQVVLKRFRPKTFRENADDNYHEAVILSGLSHPAVPELLGVLNIRQGYFFILEYKPGDTLKDLLFREKTEFSDDQILRIGSQLLDILTYIHSRSVVHGDLSISNVTDDGEHVSLLDFGLARYMDGISITPDQDHACFGNLLLYLLYSRYHGKKFGAWYQELDLPAAQELFLKRLLGLGQKYTSTPEVRKAFLEVFS